MAEPDLCPLCSAKPLVVMYAGLPMKLCADESCGCCWGFWSWVTLFTLGGYYFVAYAPGTYWRTLWRWLTDKEDE